MKKILFITATNVFGGYENESISIENLLNEIGFKVDVLLLNNFEDNTKLKHFNSTNIFSVFNVISLPFKYFIIKIILYFKYVFFNKNIDSINLYRSNVYLRPYFTFQKYSVKTLNFINKFDYVYIHGQPKEIMINIAFISRKLNKKIFYHEITSFSHDYVNRRDNIEFVKKSKLINYFIGCSMEKINRAKNTLNKNITYFHIEQWAYIYESKLIKLPIKVKKKKIQIGIISRFDNGKGILEAVKVIIKLINEKYINNLEFVIVGDGALKNELNLLVDSNKCEEYIKLCGMKTGDDIVEMYNMIDVVIIPSLEEGGPIVGLEAMASGCVILSADVGAMPERIINGKNGFIFERNNWNDFKCKLIGIYNLSELEFTSISNNAKKKYISNYSKNNIVNNYINMFNLI